MRLVLLSCSWICGIYLGSKLTLPVHIIASLFVAPLLLLLLWRQKRVLVWTSICLATLIGGVLLFRCTVTEPNLHLYNEHGLVQIKGSLDGDSEYDGNMTRIRLSAHHISVDGTWSDVSGVVLVYCRGYAAYGAGDKVVVIGELQTPISNTGETQWRSGGVQSVMFSPSIEMTGRGWLCGLRNRLSDSLAAALPEPQGAVAQGLLLGIRGHVPESLAQDFRVSGTAHIMAVSGFNVAIVGGVVLAFSAWVFGRQRPTYVIVSLGAVWLYALLAGMQCPVYRAAIMFSLVLVALWVGRPYSAAPAIAFAAAVVVGSSPKALWDVSFQLTFASVIGIVLLVPPLLRMGERAAGVLVGDEGLLASIAKPLLTSVAVGLGAMIATLPLIAYYFGSIPLVGLPATLAVLPAVPGATIVPALVATAGLFSPLLAHALGWVAWVFLTYITWVVECFASFPLASSHVSNIDSRYVWIYYGVLLGILWSVPSRRYIARRLSRSKDAMLGALDKAGDFSDRIPKKRWLALGLTLVAILIWAAVAAAPDDHRLNVSFLDVGQGDSILIVTPAGQQILVDGGPDPDRVCLELSKKLPFWDRSLDLVVLTHPDDDHLAGLPEVLKRYEVKQVLESGLEVNSPAYQEWLTLIKEKNIERTIAIAGQEIVFGEGVIIDVLNPQRELTSSDASDVNNNSVVLRLVSGDVGFMLTGDIEQEVEQELVHVGCAPGTTVLKVSHHGSNGATSRQFLASVQPQVAVVSVGEGNTFGHPHEDVIMRLENVVGADKIYVTSRDGTVTFTTDGKRLWVDTDK